MAEFVNLSDIQVKPNRQRRNFDLPQLMELGRSLGESAYGMMHAVVVERGEGGALFLLAGERRFRATKMRADLGQAIRYCGEPVPLGQIPIAEISSLDPIDAFEAELEENIRRQDLTIVEKAQATARLMELRAAQAARDGREAPSVADLAREIYDIPNHKPTREIGGYHTTVRNQLMVAKHADAPEVRKAVSLKEAVQAVKKIEERAHNAGLAAAIGPTFTANDLQLLNVDSMEWARSAPANQFDIILTDPPYGMGAHEFGDSGASDLGVGSHSYDDSYENWQRIMRVFCAESFRLAAPDAHAYVFCDFSRFEELRERMVVAGWKVFRTPIIWHNPDGFRTPWVEKGPQRKYECVLFALKGEKRVNAVKGDVLTYRKDAQVGHPAQKPVGLLSDLLARSYSPTSHVWDPFAGTASVGEACYDLKIRYSGQELDPAHYGNGLKRLRGLSSFDPALL